MYKLLIILGLISSPQVFGGSHRGMVVEEFSTTLKNYECGVCSYRNPYTPDTTYTFGLSQLTKLDLYRYTGATSKFSLDLDTDFFLDSDKFVEYVGLDYSVGMSYLGKDWGVATHWVHHSSHTVERESPATYEDSAVRFPLKDYVQVKIIWRYE